MLLNHPGLSSGNDRTIQLQGAFLKNASAITLSGPAAARMSRLCPALLRRERSHTIPTSGWNPDRVRNAFQRGFPDGHLVVVSNRQPYAHERKDGGVKIDRPAGGLALALDPVMQAVGGTWIAWGHGSADRDVVDEHDRVRVPPEDPAYTLRRLWLTDEEIENYYLGYANQALWPLCHNVLEHVRFSDRHWSFYRSANRKFSDAIVEEIEGRDALVWVQDYHLALTSGYVRRRRKDVVLSQFWHIPWPAWETLRVCPQKVQLLEGLLANDLLGFHLDTFVTNFLYACVRELDAFVDWGKRSIVYQGHLTAVRAFPISIDVHHFDALARSDITRERMERIRKKYRLEGQKIGIGVDRLDYSKGILERLDALRLLFERHPELVGKLTFLQVAVPSREEIPAYQRLAEKIDHKIDELNELLGTDDWKPVIYVKTGVPQEQLVALYRLADVIVISSVQDGMNLVVKEFIATQGAEPGAVCLSEFAGAAEEVGQSIPINPFHTEGFADQLYRAIILPIGERRERMARMKSALRQHTIYTWMADFLAAAGQVRAEAAMAGRP
jgi:trehalose 6-phosphate synthase/phosphatase